MNSAQALTAHQALAVACRNGERAVLHALVLEIDRGMPATKLFANDGFADAVLALLSADNMAARAARVRVFTNLEYAQTLIARSESARTLASAIVGATLRMHPNSMFNELAQCVLTDKFVSGGTYLQKFVKIATNMGQPPPPLFYMHLHLRISSGHLQVIVEAQLDGPLEQLSACVLACVHACNTRALSDMLATPWAWAHVTRKVYPEADVAPTGSVYRMASVAVDDLRAAIRALPCATLAANMCTALEHWTAALGRVLGAPVDLAPLPFLPAASHLCNGLGTHVFYGHTPGCWEALAVLNRTDPAFVVEMAHGMPALSRANVTQYWGMGLRALALLELDGCTRNTVERAVDALSCDCMNTDIWLDIDAALAACKSHTQAMWLRQLVWRMLHAINGYIGQVGRMHNVHSVKYSSLNLETKLFSWAAPVDIDAVCDRERSWPVKGAINVLGAHMHMNSLLGDHAVDTSDSEEQMQARQSTFFDRLLGYVYNRISDSDLLARRTRNSQLDLASYDLEYAYKEYVAYAACVNNGDTGDTGVGRAALYIVARLYVRHVADVLGEPPSGYLIVTRYERPQDAVWFVTPLLPRLDWPIARAVLARVASDTWNTASHVPAPALLLARWSPERHRHASCATRAALCTLLVLARGARQMALRAPETARGALSGLRSLPNELLCELYMRMCDVHNPYANILHETFTHEDAPAPGWLWSAETFAHNYSPASALKNDINLV